MPDMPPSSEAKPAKTGDDYHRSRPPVPTGLVLLATWAKSKGLTAVCVRKWAWAGKLNTYRVPGYGLRSFVKPAEADKLTTVQQTVPDLAR